MTNEKYFRNNATLNNIQMFVRAIQFGLAMSTVKHMPSPYFTNRDVNTSLFGKLVFGC